MIKYWSIYEFKAIAELFSVLYILIFKSLLSKLCLLISWVKTNLKLGNIIPAQIISYRIFDDYIIPTATCFVLTLWTWHPFKKWRLMEQSLIYTRPAHLQQISTKERLRRNLDVRYGRLRVPGLVLSLVLRDVEGGERELYRRGTDTEAGARTAVLTPQLPHLLPPCLHQSLVLRHSQLLTVHYAGPLGPGPVPE